MEIYKFHSPGTAISYTRIDSSGKMWVGNYEHETQVNFCPMTGKPAPTRLKVFNVWKNGTEEYN